MKFIKIAKIPSKSAPKQKYYMTYVNYNGRKSRKSFSAADDLKALELAWWFCYYGDFNLDSEELSDEFEGKVPNSIEAWTSTLQDQDPSGDDFILTIKNSSGNVIYDNSKMWEQGEDGSMWF